MRAASESKLRSILSHLLEADRHYEQARATRDAAQKAFWSAQTARVDAIQAAAKLLEAEAGVVIHDGHSFERIASQQVRITRVARELLTEQPDLGLDHAAG